MASATKISIDMAARQVRITWSCGNGLNLTSDAEQSYPFVWLRDVCHCEKCYHPQAQAYRRIPDEIDVECSPKHAEIMKDGIGVHVEWEDGHISDYPVAVLQPVKFTNKVDKLPPPNLQLWGSEFSIPKFSFQKVMDDDRTLLEWIRTLWKTGLCVLTGAPERTGQLHEIAERIGCFRETVYGETFHVIDKNEPSALGYTSSKLGMHTDFSYHSYTPGIQMLHCIVQTKSEGGQNQFADGFHAAEKLRIEHPEYFRLLTTLPIDFFDVGVDTIPFDFNAPHPVIRVDQFGGHVTKITLSEQGRYRLYLHRRFPLEEVEKFYRAYRTFYELLYRPDNLVEYRLKEGDIATFHNFRVLHARAAYELNGKRTTGVERHLEGVYFDWDEMISRARVVQRQLNLDHHEHEIEKTFVV